MQRTLPYFCLAKVNSYMYQLCSYEHNFILFYYPPEKLAIQQARCLKATEIRQVDQELFLAGPLHLSSAETLFTLYRIERLAFLSNVSA